MTTNRENVFFQRKIESPKNKIQSKVFRYELFLCSHARFFTISIPCLSNLFSWPELICYNLVVDGDDIRWFSF